MRERCEPGCFCWRCGQLNRIATKRTTARIGTPEKRLKAVRDQPVRDVVEKVQKSSDGKQVARRKGSTTVPGPMLAAIREALTEGQSLRSISIHSGHSRDKIRNIRRQMEREGLL